MATRMSAVTLDLSRFDPPRALTPLDFEEILQERLADMIARFNQRDIPYEVNDTEYDPLIVLEETDAGRELKVVGMINDSVRAVLVAFAVGSDLDHLGLRFGVYRRVITPATGNTPAVMESDAEFRRRILWAPEAFAAAGPEGAYIYHALTADPRVLNVDVWSPAPGRVTVAIQSREGTGEASEDLLVAVSKYLNRDDIRPLTDVINVQSVVNIPFSISLVAYIHPGPDETTVKDLIEKSVRKMVASRRTPSRDMPLSAITAAAALDMVERVALLTPSANLSIARGEVPDLQSLTVVVEPTDE